MDNKLNRRSFLKSGLVGGGLLALPWWACSPVVGKPDFSIVFMTDIHVNDELNAPEGLKKALHHAKYNVKNPVDMIVTGGDLVYDCLHKDEKATTAQYDLFNNIIKESGFQFHHVMGNHEMMGVYKDSGVSAEDPLFGKNYFLEYFDLEKTYKSFDYKGWHFVLLDTVGILEEKHIAHVDAEIREKVKDQIGRDYLGYVDDKQLEWLKKDLENTQLPSVVFGHIPLFTNLWELQQGTEEPDHPKMAIQNVDEVAAILYDHKDKVKLVLAGHLHINETWVYQGIEFANIGAVSGRWWRGPRHGCEEGFAVLEFRGQDVLWNYVDYGWEAV